MTWTAPVTRATGYIVLASDWNNEHVNNLLHLHGDSGTITLNDAIQVPTGKYVSTGPANTGFTGSQTTGVIIANGVIRAYNTVGFSAYEAGLTTDSVVRFGFNYAGLLNWGPGGAGAQDTSMQRIAAGELAFGTTTQGVALRGYQSATGNFFFRGFISSEGNPRFTITGAGDLNWGPGSTAVDTSLKRLGVGLLGVVSNGFGYTTGSGGGSITQATSRNTGVTVSPNPAGCGQIITNATSLAAGATATFVVTCSSVVATDTIIISVQNNPVTGSNMIPIVTAVSAGSFQISYTNNAGAATTQALTINWAIMRAVTA